MGGRRRVKSCGAWNHQLRKDAREQNRQLLRGTVKGEGRSAALRNGDALEFELEMRVGGPEWEASGEQRASPSRHERVKDQVVVLAEQTAQTPGALPAANPAPQGRAKGPSGGAANLHNRAGDGWLRGEGPGGGRFRQRKCPPPN